jgi:type I restriction enzyme R subunit
MVSKESTTTEDPIIKMSEKLDWEYIQSSELDRDFEEPFDQKTLKELIKKLNPSITSEEQVDRIVSSLKMVSNDVSGNEEFFKWIKGEKSLILRPGEKATTIKLIDFENIENNRFVVTNQLWFQGHERVRFDIVLFINGLPLVVIEAKSLTKEETEETTPYEEALNQLLRYHREAPQFMKYLAFVCPCNGVILRYGWDDTGKFFEWRDPKREEGEDPVKIAVESLFNKKTFLDMVENFIVFEKERSVIRKKIARYNQFNAANEIMKRVLEGKVKKGLIWHFQGSGKTLTMLFAAWKLKKIPQLSNPAILVVVDRKDLESQHLGTFKILPYTDRADSKRSLREKLSRDTREIIITTIQKFGGIEKILNRKENVVILIDEAHRSQYGTLAAYMRRALPNAFIFGFTGTPIDKGALGKSTFRVFGKHIDKYSMKDSIHDGATVPIYYLPKWMEYTTERNRKELDEEFYRRTLGLSEDDQERILQRSVRIKQILKASDRVEKVAKNIAEHFKKNVDPLGFKAQLVAVDREACALYKDALDKHLPPEYSVVIYTPGPNDPPFLKRFVKDQKEKDRLVKEVAQGSFQKPGENPGILIITDMLLTGFDAPVEQVMYLDKPMRDHRLLQAIARTNRPYPQKLGGLVVDYVGIFEDLVKVLNFHEEDIDDIEKAVRSIEQWKKEFSGKISSLMSIFRDIEKDYSRDSLFKAIRILEENRKAKEFKKTFSRLKDLYETIAPDPFLIEYLPDYKWLLAVNVSYNRVHGRESRLVEFRKKTEELVRREIKIKEIEREIPIFEIDEGYLKKLDKAGYSETQKISELGPAIIDHIKINLEKNPIYETFYQRLQRIMRLLDKKQKRAELEKLVGDIIEFESKRKELGATKLEYAMMGAIKKVAPAKNDEELLPIVKNLLSQVKNQMFPGWSKKKVIRVEIARRLFDACMQELSAERPGMDKISKTSDELVKFLERYRG